MFCMYCSKQLPPDAAFCPNCGRKVEAPSPADTSASDISADKTDPAQPSSGETVRNAPGETPEKIDTGINYALFVIIMAMFNCGLPFNLVLGIAAVLFADKAERNIRARELDEARANAKTAKILCIIAFAITGIQLLLFTFIFILMMLAAGR